MLMHESDFTYDQTQQVAKERQRVELSSDGLYDIQTLSITLNTTELDSESPPTFAIEWGGRESDIFTFQQLQEDTGKQELEQFICMHHELFGVHAEVAIW